MRNVLSYWLAPSVGCFRAKRLVLIGGCVTIVIGAILCLYIGYGRYYARSHLVPNVLAEEHLGSLLGGMARHIEVHAAARRPGLDRIDQYYYLVDLHGDTEELMRRIIDGWRCQANYRVVPVMQYPYSDTGDPRWWTPARHNDIRYYDLNEQFGQAEYGRFHLAVTHRDRKLYILEWRSAQSRPILLANPVSATSHPNSGGLIRDDAKR